MSKLRKGISLGLLGLAAGGLMTINVQAQQDVDSGMKGNMPSYADFDLNGDGKIVEQEFNEAHEARMSEMAAQGRQMPRAGEFPGFSGIDTDADGVISEEEFATHQAEHREEMQEQKEQKKPLASNDG